MGCDIHFVIEKKVNNKWIGLVSTDYGYRPMAKERNYNFFSAIASVRGNGNRDPIGLPRDPSDLSRLLVKEWDCDGHSISWMMLRDFAESCFESAFQPDISRKEWAIYDFLGIHVNDYDNGSDSEDKYRVVFLFDN